VEEDLEKLVSKAAPNCELAKILLSGREPTNTRLTKNK